MDLKEIGCADVDWTHITQDGVHKVYFPSSSLPIIGYNLTRNKGSCGNSFLWLI